MIEKRQPTTKTLNYTEICNRNCFVVDDVGRKNLLRKKKWQHQQKQRNKDREKIEMEMEMETFKLFFLAPFSYQIGTKFADM